MALTNESKLLCCFLAERSTRSYRTGKPHSGPSPRLLARLVELFQRTWPRSKKPPRSWEAAALSVSTETLRVWRLGTTQLSSVRMNRFFAELLKRASVWPSVAAKRTATQNEGADPPQASEQDRQVVQDLRTFVGLVGRAERVYEAREVLGFDSVTEMQQAIDTYVYRRQPLLESFWLPRPEGTDDAVTSDQGVRRLLGHFLVYIRRGAHWWRCPCRVRYLLTLDHDQAFLRFKMEVPAPTPREQSANSLDGAVMTTNNAHVSWIAAPRSRDQRDFMSFITGAVLQEIPESVVHWTQSMCNGCRATKGKYLTTDQNTNEVVADDLLLVRYREPDQDELVSQDDTNLMQTVARLNPETDADEIRQVKSVFGYLSGVRQPRKDGKSGS